MGTGMAYGRCEIPGPSMERRRDTLQADLGCLCCVFPGACEVAFLLENQGGLEKLVHHESLRQKLAILTRKPEQSNVTTTMYATVHVRHPNPGSYTSKLESG